MGMATMRRNERGKRAASERMFYPVECPHCAHVLRADDETRRPMRGLPPVGASMLRLATAVAFASHTAREIADALGLSRDSVTAGMRRAERAGLVSHTSESIPRQGGRRSLYAATALLRAYIYTADDGVSESTEEE